ncbi:hypothetical protein Csa_011309 [Cucumis sativus]|uniref:Uncharacterized protein n=1 Tax=Cucumis sativus TaxID=3659 RepID=A0A0A0L669_CUCSA|nr:hypothetical protein Csa_011309 [Cucumis sativus]
MTSKIVFLVLLGALVCSTFEARKLSIASSTQDEKFEDHGLVDGELSGRARGLAGQFIGIGFNSSVSLGVGVGSPPVLYVGTPPINVGIGVSGGSENGPSGGGK